MGWSAKKFDILVENTEKFARKNITLYRFQVALFAILGYCYLFLIITFFFFPLILFSIIYSSKSHQNIWGWIHITLMYLPIFPFIFSTLRSFRVLFKNGLPPKGKYLNRVEFPKLFDLIDEITNKLKVPTLKNVVLNEELNAAVIQVSKLGIFGWYENYLILGIPLMSVLSTDEFRSVLVHEIGHLSGNHSRFNGWIFRLRETLTQMQKHMQKVNEGHTSIFVTPFIRWYIPFFDAYSFILARINEYDADKFALQLTGAENCALSMIKIEIANGFVNNIFWQNIYQNIEHQPKPPDDVYTKLLVNLNDVNTFKNNYNFLKKALARKTNNFDTHPCLTQSLKNLGYNKFPDNLLDKLINFQNINSQKSAAKVLLGNKLQNLVFDLDRNWQQQIETSWLQRYATVQDILQEIKVLSENYAGETFDIEDDWKLVYLYLELNQKEVVVQKLKQIIKYQPDFVDAHYLLGKILLQQDNKHGMKYLETALSLNLNYTEDCLRLLINFFRECGEVKKANRYRDRLDAFYLEVNQANIERSTITDKDKFLPHQLERSEIIQIKQQISQFFQIKEVYLVQKQVNHFSNIPFYILGVVRKFRFYNFESDNVSYQLQIALKNQLQILSDYEVVVVESRNYKIIKQMRKIENSLIYMKK